MVIKPPKLPEYQIEIPKLHNYQLKAKIFCKQHHQCYLAIDMGLGKTRIALELIAEKKVSLFNKIPFKGALVVAPLRAIYNTWPEEIFKWSLDLEFEILHGPNKLEALKRKADIYLINPEGFKWLYGVLKKIYYEQKVLPLSDLIVDEGSMWKDQSTKRFGIIKAMLPIFQDYKLILSGTPSPNSYLDLWSQYYIIDEGITLGTSITRYKNKFFKSVDKDKRVYIARERAHKDIYRLIRSKTFRLDAKDYLNIPDRIDNKIELKFTPKLLKQYNVLENKFFLDLDTKKVEAFNIRTLSNKLRQFIQGGIYTKHPEWHKIHNLKLEVLKELVDTASGQGILCAIQFKFELQMLRKIFPTAPAIVGGTKSAEANKYIKDWNNQKIPLLICHPASLGRGVNLQLGSHIIVWLGLPWSLDLYQQLNGRLHRQGQVNKVIVHHIMIKNTTDYAIFKALTSKDSSQTKLLNCLRNYQQSKINSY